MVDWEIWILIERTQIAIAGNMKMSRLSGQKQETLMDRVDLLWFGGGKEVDSRGLSRQSDFVLIIVAFWLEVQNAECFCSRRPLAVSQLRPNRMELENNNSILTCILCQDIAVHSK